MTTGFTLSLAHILLSSANAMSMAEEGGVGGGGPSLTEPDGARGGAGGRAEVEELPESKVHREAWATSPAAPEEKCKIRFALRRARTADVKTEED